MRIRFSFFGLPFDLFLGMGAKEKAIYAKSSFISHIFGGTLRSQVEERNEYEYVCVCALQTLLLCDVRKAFSFILLQGQVCSLRLRIQYLRNVPGFEPGGDSRVICRDGTPKVLRLRGPYKSCVTSSSLCRSFSHTFLSLLSLVRFLMLRISIGVRRAIKRVELGRK